MTGESWKLGDGGRRVSPELEDARARVLHGGIQYVETVGFSLGIRPEVLDGITAEAGVSAKQFGKIWPSTEAFLADLFCELAYQARIDRADTQTLLSTWQYLSTRIDDMGTVEGRRRVLADLVRIVTKYNFEVITAATKWQTYAALSTTITAWPEGEARTRMLEALQASEIAFVDTMESFYRNLMPTTGLRLKPAFHNDFQPFVVAASAVIEGLGIVRATVPALVEAHFELPTDGGEVETWSVASVAFMGVIDAFFEPNPDYDAEDAVARLSTGFDLSPQSGSDSL